MVTKATTNQSHRNAIRRRANHDISEIPRSFWLTCEVEPQSRARACDLGCSQLRVVETSSNLLGWRTKSGEVLSIESAQRSFDRWADANDALCHARTKKRDPELAAKQKLRPASGRRAARM